MAREYGRAPKGERCHDTKPKNWGENISVIGALSLGGLEAVMTLNGALNRDWFDKWVKEFLVPVLRKGDVVVMDNLSVHKSAKARKLIEKAGASVVFLPPYSPDFNPIEQAWSKLKALLRKQAPRSREALEDALCWALDQITASDALAWILNAGYRSWLVRFI